MTSVQHLTTSARGSVSTVLRHRLLVLAVFAVIVVGGIVFVDRMQRDYVAGANLLVVNGTTRDDPTLSSPDLPSIAASTVVLSRVKQEVGLDLPLIAIKRHLTVKPPPFRSSVLRIEYTDPQPDRAMKVANGVAEELTRYYREISTARFDDDLRALDAELAKEWKQARRLDEQLQRHNAPLALSDKPSDAASSQFADLEATRALAVATLVGDRSHLEALRTNGARRAKMLRYDVLRNDPAYHDLEASASASAVQLANVRAQFTAEYPALPALIEKVQSLRTAMNAEADRALKASNAYSPLVETSRIEERQAAAVVAADQAKVDAYDGLLAKERARNRTMPAVVAFRLQREATQASYLAISARRATALANRADALSLGSVVIVDRAIATEAQVVGLGKNRLLAMMVALAFIVAITSAFLADQLNPRLSRAAQIEELYGRPVVANFGKM